MSGGQLGREPGITRTRRQGLDRPSQFGSCSRSGRIHIARRSSTWRISERRNSLRQCNLVGNQSYAHGNSADLGICILDHIHLVRTSCDYPFTVDRYVLARELGRADPGEGEQTRPFLAWGRLIRSACHPLLISQPSSRSSARGSARSLVCSG